MIRLCNGTPVFGALEHSPLPPLLTCLWLQFLTKTGVIGVPSLVKGLSVTDCPQT